MVDAHATAAAGLKVQNNRPIVRPGVDPFVGLSAGGSAREHFFNQRMARRTDHPTHLHSECRTGRLTPRSVQLGRNWTAEHIFCSSLRPDMPVRRRQRAASAGVSRPRPPPPPMDDPTMGGTKTANAKRASEGGGHNSGPAKFDDFSKATSHAAFADKKFYETLRSWPRARDMKDFTPADWRVSTDQGSRLNLGGAGWGHDMSLNDADGWKRSSVHWVESQFRGNMRNYPGHDVNLDDMGNPKPPPKQGKHVAGTDLGNIYRDRKQSNIMTTARADEQFLGSLRNEGPLSTDEYQRRRRKHLNLPQYQELSSENVAKAKRLFATIDTDGSGTIDADELKKFLGSIGHTKANSKAVKELMQAAEEGVADGLLQVKEFCRVYHGLKL